jgi:CRISPR-associated protein Csm3
MTNQVDTKQVSVVKLHGRVFIECTIEVVTGLHIGGSDEGIQIGGIDNTIIRNPFNNQPYIPGSSLRGKMRSELEKQLGLPLNQPIGPYVRIHSPDNKDDYEASDVARIFGIAPPSEGIGITTLTRLIVRDVALTEECQTDLEERNTDLPYAEIKTEVAIDRVTSAATPRDLERVPAGAEFGPAQLIFSVYELGDFDLLPRIFQGMQLVEDSYLGGQGSRGSGQVEFKDISVVAKTYLEDDQPLVKGKALSDLDVKEIVAKAREAIVVE